MIAPAMHAWIGRWPISLLTLVAAIVVPSILLLVTLLLLLRLLWIVIPTFTLTFGTRHIANFHRYNISILYITLITIPTLIILRTETSVRILPIINCECHGLCIIHSVRLLQQHV